MPRIITKFTENIRDRYEFARTNISRTAILHHSALVLIVLVSLVVRLYPFLKFEVKLKAFDPYSQLKAARYIEANGTHRKEYQKDDEHYRSSENIFASVKSQALCVGRQSGD
ncbi:hypothetical protein, partial [Desulfosarcina sp.]|uniref:hypothetical protein n=1 Tax=Desulfosarcina sp. TaxID=2027861 RepID=UPI00356AD0BC